MRMKTLLIFFVLINSTCFAEAEEYKDSSGAIIGRSSTVNEQTTYTNDIGQIVGKSSMSGDTTVYQNSTGAIIGRSNPTSAYGAPVPPRGALSPLPLPKGVYPWMLDQ